MNKVELARRIKSVSYLTGSFTLRSGKSSCYYLDKYCFESDPKLLRGIVSEMQKLLPPHFDRLAGLELGGIPLATAISLATDKPCLFVRKVAKSYGTCNLVEGGFRPGDVAVVIEDVITVGGQACTSIPQMRELGLAVQQVVCVLDRLQGGRQNLEDIGCSLVSVFTSHDLEG